MSRKLLLFSLLVVISDAYAQGKRLDSRTLWGDVFYDKNQNGLQEADEVGVGGIKFKLSNGESFYNSTDGSFEHLLSNKKQILSFRIDSDSIPAGSYLTTPPEYVIGRADAVGRVRKFNFGLYFDYLDKELFQKSSSVKAPLFFNIPNKASIFAELKADGLYFGPRLWQPLPTLQSPVSSPKTQDFVIDFESFSLELNELDILGLKRFLRMKRERVKKVKISSRYGDNSKSEEVSLQKARILAREVRLFLIKNGLDPNNIELETSVGKNALKVDVVTQDSPEPEPERVCRFQIKGRNFISLKLGSPIEIDHQPHRRSEGEIRCDGQSYPFVIPRIMVDQASVGTNPLKKLIKGDRWILKFLGDPGTKVYWDDQVLNTQLSIQKDVLLREYSFEVESNGIRFPYSVTLERDRTWKEDKSDQMSLVLRHSPYIREGRDLKTFFWLKANNAKEFFVNGRKFKEMDNFVPYVLKGERGSNKLNIELIDKQKRLFEIGYPYTLAFDPKYSFSLNWGINSIENQTTFQATRYSLSAVQKASLDMSYFWNEREGVHLDLNFDVIPINLNKIVGGVEEVRHKEYGIHYQWRFWGDYKDYNSARFTLFGGLRVRSFNTETPVTVLLPETLWGLDLGIEYMEREAFLRGLDLATQLFFTLGGRFNGNRNIRLTQELRWSLNWLGTILGDTYYNYFERHRNMQHFKFVTGFHVQDMSSDIFNANQGNFNEFTYGFTLGVNFSY